MIDDTDANVAKQFAKAVRPYIVKSDIEGVRRYAIKQGKAPDWPWNRFVHAFASNGGNWHWDENIYPHLKNYRWERIAKLPSDQRKKELEYATNPRWRHNRYFEQVYAVVKKKGGPTAIKREYEGIKNSRGRIEYWKSFPGIGDKYSREIPLRSYDPHFLDDHFAIDAQLRKLLNVVFPGKHIAYGAGEAFFVAVAKSLDIKCWDLDTVLFDWADEIKKDFNKSRSAPDRLNSP